MSIFERFRSKRVIESGQALVQRQNSSNVSILEDITAHSSLVRKYKNYQVAYEKVPLISAIIDVQTDQTVQEFYFEGPNKKKLMEWADKVNLMNFFHLICKSMLIYGNGFVEIVKEGNEITELKVLNTIWMNVYRKSTGEVIGYSQIINDKPKVLWGNTGSSEENRKFEKWLPGKLDSIAHFKHNVIGSEKYGNSVIEPLLTSLKSKLDMEGNLSKVLFKYVAPLIWAKVGSNEMPATQAAVTDVANTLRRKQPLEVWYMNAFPYCQKYTTFEANVFSDISNHFINKRKAIE